MREPTPIQESGRCSSRARAGGVSATGTAGVAQRFVFAQLEPPWPERLEGHPAFDALRGADTTVRAIWPVVPEPGPERSVLTFLRAGDPFDRLTGFHGTLEGGEGARIQDGVRDIVVCTHGTRDPCCGTAGMALVRALKGWAASQGGVRLWRTSHLGGHRFAPTLVDLPTGDSWGFMDPDVTLEVLEEPDPIAIRRHHRGWWGLGSAAEQAAETEAWARIGPTWRATIRGGIVARSTTNDDRTQVTLTSATPDDQRVIMRAEVRRSMRPQVVSCGTTRDEPEYTVTHFEHSIGDVGR